jgi:hypothetical protein
MNSRIADVVVEVYEFQFLMTGAVQPSLAQLADTPLTSVVDHALCVHSASHWGEAKVRVESHGQRPPLDVQAWDDIVEIPVEVGDDGLRLSSLFGEPVQCPPLSMLAAGSYRARVCSSGRQQVADGFSHDSEQATVERFAIFVWPALPEPAEILKESAPVLAPDAADAQNASSQLRSAIRELEATVEGAGILDAGDIARARVTREVPRAIDEAFKHLTMLTAWLTGFDSDSPRPAVGVPFELFFGGSYGVVRCAFTCVDPVEHLVISWDWVTTGSWDADGQAVGRVSLLPRPASVDFRLRATPSGTTVVTVVHDGVAAAWVEGLEATWSAALRVLARVGRR